MKKKDLEKRISELELLIEQKDRLINQLLNEMDNKMPEVIPYVVDDNLCTDGKDHEYPMPWHSIYPAPCKKCGKLAEQYPITYTTGNPPWDMSKFGGNIMNVENTITTNDNTSSIYLRDNSGIN